MSESEKRIIVEVIAHAEVERLRDELRLQDEKHRAEVAALRRELEGLHRTFYEFLDAFGPGRRK